ncbi:MAG: hypothetical protein RE468_00815 [Acidithiobacillus caldus]|uniref:hypothetical protein n=1 Tax=Acidithiobacillus caldus TaxID=33059 RepID=UPI00114CD0E6|nr:hypothetical protein [Acidithiobacillus caldus]WMT47205.1 MAG: hypothetical protein RE468_00815 [Acidithiobacillus caldus]
MPRPALPYSIQFDFLPDIYALSPWSLSEIARRFGLGRSVLMGLLRGERTVGEDRLQALLRWSGLDVSGCRLHLAGGLHVWQVASDKQLEALDHLPVHLRPEDAWEIVVEPDRPQREWVHLLGWRGPAQVLLSVRPTWYPLLRNMRPALGAPRRLRGFASGTRYEDLAATLGERQMHLPPSKIGQILVDLPQDGVTPEREAWGQWLRQALHLDTSAWAVAPMAEATPVGENASETIDARAGDLVWTRLSHRLDLGSDHRDICEVPLFRLGEEHPYPIGMVRLDRVFLGDVLFDTGKAERLRIYLDDASGERWLVEMAEPCRMGLPRAVPVRRAGQRVLVHEGGQLAVVQAKGPEQAIVGRVRWRIEQQENRGS